MGKYRRRGGPPRCSACAVFPHGQKTCGVAFPAGEGDRGVERQGIIDQCLQLAGILRQHRRALAQHVDDLSRGGHLKRKVQSDICSDVYRHLVMNLGGESPALVESSLASIDAPTITEPDGSVTMPLRH